MARESADAARGRRQAACQVLTTLAGPLCWLWRGARLPGRASRTGRATLRRTGALSAGHPSTGFSAGRARRSPGPAGPPRHWAPACLRHLRLRAKLLALCQPLCVIGAQPGHEVERAKHQRDEDDKGREDGAYSPSQVNLLLAVAALLVARPPKATAIAVASDLATVGTLGSTCSLWIPVCACPTLSAESILSGAEGLGAGACLAVPLPPWGRTAGSRQ